MKTNFELARESGASLLCSGRAGKKENWDFTPEQLGTYTDFIIEQDRAQRQAVQEPVAWKWQHIDTDGKELNAGLSDTRVAPTDNAFWASKPEQKVETRVTELFAAPRPAQVPLTTEQVESTIRNYFADDWELEKARGLLADLGIGPK